MSKEYVIYHLQNMKNQGVKQQKSMATIPTVMAMAISELTGYFYGIKYTFYNG